MRFCTAAEPRLRQWSKQMALDTETGVTPYEAPEKDLYEVGEMPPLGYVPKQMYAWAIRRERHGEPD